MKKQIQILVILVLVILTGVIIYFRYLPKENKLNLPTKDRQSNIPKLKTFKSANLDFTVQVPENYSITEKLVTVEFKLGEHFINVGRNAHSFNSLKEFLTDADAKEVLNASLVKELEVEGRELVARDEVRGGVKVRMYYIFTPEWVYIFSTDSESLYSDLDQIAQSFRYTP